jgi:hypothetical protein
MPKVLYFSDPSNKRPGVGATIARILSDPNMEPDHRRAEGFKAIAEA